MFAQFDSDRPSEVAMPLYKFINERSNAFPVPSSLQGLLQITHHVCTFGLNMPLDVTRVVDALKAYDNLVVSMARGVNAVKIKRLAEQLPCTGTALIFPTGTMVLCGRASAEQQRGFASELVEMLKVFLSAHDWQQPMLAIVQSEVANMVARCRLPLGVDHRKLGHCNAPVSAVERAQRRHVGYTLADGVILRLAIGAHTDKRGRHVVRLASAILVGTHSLIVTGVRTAAELEWFYKRIASYLAYFVTCSAENAVPADDADDGQRMREFETQDVEMMTEMFELLHTAHDGDDNEE